MSLSRTCFGDLYLFEHLFFELVRCFFFVEFFLLNLFDPDLLLNLEVLFEQSVLFDEVVFISDELFDHLFLRSDAIEVGGQLVVLSGELFVDLFLFLLSFSRGYRGCLSSL